MNIYQLIQYYLDRLQMHQDKYKASKDLYDLKYNRTLTILIPMMFDEYGNPTELPNSDD